MPKTSLRTPAATSIVIEFCCAENDLAFATRLKTELETSLGGGSAGAPSTGQTAPPAESANQSSTSEQPFLFVVSPESVNAVKCLGELQAAVDVGRLLIPIVRRDVRPETLPPALVPLPPISAGETDDFIGVVDQLINRINAKIRVDVFLSYSRKDLAFVDKLQARLWMKGKSTWIDRKKLEPSQLWWKAIKAGIDGADHYVFLLSPDSLESRYAAEEVKHAAEQNKRMVPVLIREVDLRQVPTALAERQFVRFLGDGSEEAFDKGLADLLYALNNDPNWIKDHTRLLLRANDWLTNQRDSSFLLRGQDLAQAERWLEDAGMSRDRNPTMLQTQFLLESRRASNRVLRRRAIASIFAATLILFFALGFFWQAQRASQAAFKMRTQAVIDVASTQRDPLVGALLLNDSSDAIVAAGLEPEATKAARQLMSMPLPAAVLRGHTDSVTTIDFSPNGEQIVSGSLDNEVKIWAVSGLGDPRTLLKAPESVRSVVFSKQGDKVAVACDKSVWLIPLQSGVPIKFHLQDLDSSVKRVWLSDNGAWLSARLSDSEFTVWQTRSPDRAFKFGRSGHAAASVWFGPVGDGMKFGALLVYADGAVMSYSFDSENGPQASTLVSVPLENPNENFQIDEGGETISKDGKLLAVLFGDEVGIWSLDGKQKLLRIRHNTGQKVLRTRFDSSGNRLLTVGKDGVVGIWSTNTGKPQQMLDSAVRVWTGSDLVFGQRAPGEGNTPQPLELLDARFSHDGSMVASLGTERAARLWTLAGNQPPLELRMHLKSKLAQFSRADDVLATIDGNEIRLWRLPPLLEPTVFYNGFQLRAGAFAPGGNYVLTGGDDGIARLWSIDRPNEIVAFSAKAGSVYHCSFSPDGAKLATSYEDGTARLWNKDGGAPFKVFTEHKFEAGGHLTVRFSPNGRQLLSYREGGFNTRVWNIDGEAASKAFEEGSKINNAEYNADGSRILSVYEDGQARIWSPDNSRPIVILGNEQGRHGRLYTGSFSRDGRFVVLGAGNGTAEIWRSDGQGCPIILADDWKNSPIQSDDNWIWAAAFSPHGQFVATGTPQGRVLVWRADGKGRPRELSAPELRSARGKVAHLGPVSGLCFSSKGNYLATWGGFDGAVRIWPMKNLDAPTKFAYPGAVIRGEFDDNESRVLGVYESGIAMVSRVSWPEIATFFGSATTATLLPDQRIQQLRESPAEAKERYEASERRFQRTPLPDPPAYVEFDR